MDKSRTRKMQERLAALSPQLQEAFLRAMQQVYAKESEYMLKFIEESRNEMRSTAYCIREEQEVLKETMDILLAGRHGHPDIEAEYLKDMQLEVSPSSSFRVEREVVQKQKEHYIKKGDKGTTRFSKATPNSLSLASPVPDTPENMRSLYEEESTEMIQRMRGVSAKMENERERQLEQVNKKREKKRAEAEERATTALELLKQASDLESYQLRDKERQEQMMREKLEEKKKKKTRLDLNADGDKGDAIEDIPPEEKKSKKKKKKKDKDRDNLDEETKKEKKKKKHKRKEEKEAEVTEL